MPSCHEQVLSLLTLVCLLVISLSPQTSCPAQSLFALTLTRGFLSWLPDVKIQHSPILNYWLVTIVSKDRNKLFFDTVCTFADLNYDVYHSTIDRSELKRGQTI